MSRHTETVSAEIKRRADVPSLIEWPFPASFRKDTQTHPLGSTGVRLSPCLKCTESDSPGRATESRLFHRRQPAAFISYRPENTLGFSKPLLHRAFYLFIAATRNYAKRKGFMRSGNLTYVEINAKITFADGRV